MCVCMYECDREEREEETGWVTRMDESQGKGEAEAEAEREEQWYL